MLAVSGGRRQRGRDRMAVAARDYAALGWACIPGAHPLTRGDRACSCDRVGCPDPGAHPVSAAWGLEAGMDPAVLTRWWNERPQANIILPTGRVFDVFDIPAAAGAMALDRIRRTGVPVGPVAASGDERHLFFVATRGAPQDEDEWWSCHLDCSPENVAETPGMRWHCRDSYVVAPPSVLPQGEVTWIRPPDDSPLPDPLRLLEVLADSCEQV
ncbi:MAG TPA: bifunctional DNA primase/polymerase [Actinomadura sp.]|nr:bifunctional DNA primase/polymerase [Actinomadura sp.]